jgi:hypothetical protein
MANYVTVKELIEKLHKFPQNKRVVIEVTDYCEPVGEIENNKDSVIIHEGEW